MIKLSNLKLVSVFINLFILLVLAKAVSLFVWWYLPSDGIKLSVKENYQPKYQRVDFKNMLKEAKSKQANHPENAADNGVNITNMVLKGLYGTKTKGYVIVAMKSTPDKTSIIAVGESFKGYVLKAIFPNSAKFYKNGTYFILSFEKIKKSNSISKVKNESANVQTPSNVSRKDISFYSKNPEQIWKDISINEIKEGKKIKGFKVTRIKQGSRLARLGLKKGDLIIKANNVELNSYADVLQIYKNIDNLDTVQIVVMRNNQEVELVYEIY